MAVLLLAGPPAVGHNTIAEAFCALRPRAALVDGDEVREMLFSPGSAEWGSDEAERQYRLGIRNCCALARSFDADGCDVAQVDVAAPGALDLYRSELQAVNDLRIVLLIADPDVLVARDIARDPDPGADPAALAAWHARIRELQAELAANANSYDVILDTGAMSAQAAAEQLVALVS